MIVVWMSIQHRAESHFRLGKGAGSSHKSPYKGNSRVVADVVRNDSQALSSNSGGHTRDDPRTTVSLYLPIRTHQGDIDDKLAGNCRYRETYPTSSVPAREGSFFCLPALA